jgi:hypothetical protein
MAFKQNNKQIKKIIKELKGASKLHAGQAEKLESMVEKSPAKLREIRERLLNKGKRKQEQEQPKTPTIKEAQQYDFMKQQFEDFNPKTDTIFSGTSQDMYIAGKYAQGDADRAKAKLQGKTTKKDGATRTTYTGPGAQMKNEKFAYAKSPSGRDVFMSYRKYDKEDIKGSPAQKRMGKFKDSKAPDAEGKFRDLSAPALASWMIKSRKGNLSKIISSLNQQIIFRRNKDPKYAAKMRRTQDIVRKRLGKDKK